MTKTKLTTNHKVVRDKVLEHVLEFYDVGEVVAQLEYMRHDNEPVYQAARRSVEGGNFLVYNDDIVEFINDLGINPTNRQFSVESTWNLYTHLLAKEMERLYKNA